MLLNIEVFRCIHACGCMSSKVTGFFYYCQNWKSCTTPKISFCSHSFRKDWKSTLRVAEYFKRDNCNHNSDSFVIRNKQFLPFIAIFIKYLNVWKKQFCHVAFLLKYVWSSVYYKNLHFLFLLLNFPLILQFNKKRIFCKIWTCMDAPEHVRVCAYEHVFYVSEGGERKATENWAEVTFLLITENTERVLTFLFHFFSDRIQMCP